MNKLPTSLEYKQDANTKSQLHKRNNWVIIKDLDKQLTEDVARIFPQFR